jgi:hypothetical protein
VLDRDQQVADATEVVEHKLVCTLLIVTVVGICARVLLVSKLIFSAGPGASQAPPGRYSEFAATIALLWKSEPDMRGCAGFRFFRQLAWTSAASGYSKHGALCSPTLAKALNLPFERLVVHNEGIANAEVAEPFATLADPELPARLDDEAVTGTVASSGGGSK